MSNALKQALPIKDRTGNAGLTEQNSAGALTYTINDENTLRRFVVIGTEGGSFYTGQADLTKQDVETLDRLVGIDANAVVAIARDSGLVAPKRSFALFALAKAFAGGASKDKVLEALIVLVRTGTDLFEFVSYTAAYRGWGRSFKGLVNEFMAVKGADTMSLWAVKYRSRHGWTWQDLVRQAHPKAQDLRLNDVYAYMAKRHVGESLVGSVIDRFEQAKIVTGQRAIVSLVEAGLPWEALSDEQRTDEVWAALVPTLGGTALVRNLGNLTRRGILKNLSPITHEAAARVASVKQHPVKLLEALYTYQSGGSAGRGHGASYTPIQEIVRALQTAVDRNFASGEATGKAFSVNVDVSGSMTWGSSSGSILTPAQAAAGIAQAIVSAEDRSVVHAFSHVLTPVDLGKTFKSAYKALYESNAAFGGTDCSMPMVKALKERTYVDVFVVITDNETWAHRNTPAQALRDYRKAVNPNAKLVVLACTATSFTIADPTDPGMLDIAGFSSDVVDIIQAFAKI